MNPTVYPASQHTLRNSQCHPGALKVVERLHKAGYTAYLVGGSVRDLLLGKAPKDYDISTSATPEELKALFRSQCLLIGNRFVLAHIRSGKDVFEVSTFRSGDLESGELIRSDNVWGTPAQDVMRRDFTINGLFYDPSEETVIDYVNGYNDLREQHLRTIGQAHLRFKQDPVRMLRLLKFQARLDFTIDPEARLALAECSSEIVKSSQARIFEEILRMLESGFGEPFLDLIHEHRLVELLMPALAHFLILPEGETVFDLLYAADRLVSSGANVDRAVLLACIAFPPLQHYLQVHGSASHRSLEETRTQADHTISRLFQPFFLISRKLRMKMISVMSLQFRLTSVDMKHQRIPRIPRDPDFPHALQFLQLRGYGDAHVRTLGEFWNRAMKQKKRSK